ARRAGHAPRLDPLPLEYVEYLLWRQEFLGSVDDPGSLIATQLRYWREALAGLPEELDLPTDRPRPAEPSHRGDTVRFTIDAELHGRLAELARSSRTTLFMVLQAGLAVLLSRMGAGTDVPIGSVVAGRTAGARDGLVGFFANTLVLRTDTSGGPTFTELLDRVRRTDVAAYAHQGVPFERVVDAISPARTLSRHPLFQVMLVVCDQTGATLTLPGLDAAPQLISSGSARFDLLAAFHATLDRDGRPDGITGTLEYEIALFDRDTVEALAARLVRVLEQAAAEPDAPIGTIDVLDETERRRLLVDWNDTAVSTPDDRCLHELFEEQVERTPDATALIFDDFDVSYADLNAKANQLARFLVREGVRHGDLVGIYLDRSPIFITAMLAVLKVGAGYVMLDPKLPATRLLGVLDRFRPAKVITVAGRSARLATAEVDVIRMDAEMVGRIAYEPDDNLEATVDPAEMACVTYGDRPVGLVRTHRGLVSGLLGQRFLQVGPDQVFLQCAPINGDAFVLEVFAPLLFGGAVVLQPGQRPDPALIAMLVAKHDVTTLQLPAGLFNLMIDEYPVVFHVVRQAITNAEPASVTHVAKALRDFPRLHVVNAYRPAAGMGVAAAFPVAEPDVTESMTVPIGRPTANTRLYVLDSERRPVPTGVTGELYVAGGCLPDGYLNRPGRSADRFVANPFAGLGERMYRTGDLARWRANGVLELLGRADDHVTLRGSRVEVGEIEAALTGHPTLTQAAAVVREDRPGHRCIDAYVVAADGHKVSTGALREHLSGLLPEHLIPSTVVVLDALPLTACGKLDRAALPVPDLASMATGRGPRTDQERTMCQLFCDILGVPEVGIDDSFLDLGGHSVQAARLINRIRSTFGAEINIRTVFESPTVARLVERLTGAARP
ncbi:MAG TPA: AMP-binding protein, partial [Actinophytocola sp.]|uniref:non-ribosomal peptide synthetase n=1 Tax=Actinophytocola sp. TaxID=1872138 RepID=UPI002DDC91CE